MRLIKKILDLVSFDQQKRFIFLLILIFFTTVLETLGIASILPFLTLLGNSNLIETNAVLIYLFKASNTFGIISSKQFLFTLGVAVFFIFIVSLIFRALTTYTLIYFTLMLEYSIGKRLIEGYLHQPYAWFLNQHSADLGKNILSNLNVVVNQNIVPITVIFSQSPIILAILILLVVIDPILALSTGLTLMISYLVIFYFIRNKVNLIGQSHFKANQQRFITLSESFGAFKEIKIGRLEKVYINRYTKSAKIYAKSQSLVQIISQLPRYFIEGIVFGGMIILILFLMVRYSEFWKIFPIVSLYAFAGYRLIPSLQQVYYSITQNSFSAVALDLLHKDLKNLKSFDISQDEISVMQLSKNIRLSNIHFNYSNTKYAALKNINLTIPAFNKIGIVGPTGSGKSTIVDLILGLLDPSEGTLSVDGKLITNRNKRAWQKNIGYVPQQIYLSDSTVMENIALGVDINNINLEAMKKAANIANIDNFILKELPNNYYTTIGERGIRLSGGQKQRIGIARALYHEPQVLILDEATSALDNATEQAVVDAINNLGRKITTIQVTHRLNSVRNCDIIFLLVEGKLKDQGTYKELRGKNKYFKDMN
jgi:ABC-type bacteriocin/lantibiotic exporter with double-glycine peptidase domain